MKIKTLIGIGVLCAIGVSACAEANNEPQVAKPAAVAAAAAVEATVPAVTVEAAPETSATTADGPKETQNQANARAKAESYLSTMPFSEKGLIDQLKFEGFGQADATYGVKAVGADWKAQAALKAASYLDTMPFSWKGLFDQLTFEGYTAMQAEYGVNQTGLKP